jgi:hypothetical protein
MLMYGGVHANQQGKLQAASAFLYETQLVASLPAAVILDRCITSPVLLMWVCLLAVLNKGLNTTSVLWDEMQHSPYFNYRAADGLIHQVGTAAVVGGCRC